MNKQDALTKLAALEAETRALRAIIEAPDKPAVPTRWKPEGNENFWSVTSFGEVQIYCNSPDRVKFGNCFKTEQHAAIAAKAVSVTLKVCAAAFAADPDAGEYVKGTREYSVYACKKRWLPDRFYTTTSNAAYVHTQEQAKQMAAILNAEEV